MYPAVGIHPHHVFENEPALIEHSLRELEEILTKNPEIVAVGEVGLDRHYYQMTKYNDYEVNESFIDHQKNALRRQIGFAVAYDKSLILHNREAKKEFLQVVTECWSRGLAGRTVFHCCEPDTDFIQFAQEHDIFIGVDGDVTFDAAKQEFIKNVPLNMLVLETDSPFLTPEPVRSSAKKRPKNEPQYLTLVAAAVAKIKEKSVQEVNEVTTANAQTLFRLPK